MAQEKGTSAKALLPAVRVRQATLIPVSIQIVPAPDSTDPHQLSSVNLKVSLERTLQQVISLVGKLHLQEKGAGAGFAEEWQDHSKWSWETIYGVALPRSTHVRDLVASPVSGPCGLELLQKGIANLFPTMFWCRIFEQRLAWKTAVAL